MHQPGSARGACRVDDILRPGDIGSLELRPGSRHRDLGGDVNDRIDAIGCTSHRVGVSDVATHLFPGTIRSVPLKRANIVAPLEQLPSYGSTEHAGGASDQNLHGLEAPRPANTSAAHCATRVRSIFELWRMSTGSASTTRTAAKSIPAVCRRVSVSSIDA